MARHRPGRAVPGRGVHPPGDDARAGADRLPPVVHVLHLAEHRRGADRVPAASWPARPPRSCGRTSSSTPRTSCSQYLQHAGPPAFMVRAALAAMLTPSWGVYSGYELCENIPVVPGSEEYLDSEKYQYRPRDWAGAAATRALPGPVPGPAQPDPAGPSRPAPAPQPAVSLRRPAGDALLFEDLDPGPRQRRRAGYVLVVVNLDPRRPVRPQSGWTCQRWASTQRRVPLSRTSFPASLTGGGKQTTCGWTRTLPAHIFTVRTYGHRPEPQETQWPEILTLTAAGTAAADPAAAGRVRAGRGYAPAGLVLLRPAPGPGVVQARRVL